MQRCDACRSRVYVKPRQDLMQDRRLNPQNEQQSGSVAVVGQSSGL
jgi:hypothetical protein